MILLLRHRLQDFASPLPKAGAGKRYSPQPETRGRMNVGYSESDDLDRTVRRNEGFLGGATFRGILGELEDLNKAMRHIRTGARTLRVLHPHAACCRSDLCALLKCNLCSGSSTSGVWLKSSSSRLPFLVSH